MASAVEGGGSKRNKEKSTQLLPQDLIIQILLNLPVISLLRFKCVCKFWYSLIISPDFIATHHENNSHKKELSLFCYSRKINTSPGPPLATTISMSFRFNDVPMDLTVPLEAQGTSGIVGCSNGVVCLSRSPWACLHDMFVLWNPATRQFWQFGGYDHTCQYTERSYSGFCFNPIAKTFKLARLAFFPCKNNKNDVAQVSIIITSGDNSWREKTIDIPYQLSGSWRRGSVGPAISVKTSMYWDVFLDWEEGHYDEQDRYILCFDMIDEMFKRIELPHQIYSPLSSPLIVLAGYKDTLAVFAHKLTYSGGKLRSCFDVWVMNDHNGGQQSWSKKLTCEPSVDFNRALGFFSKDNVDYIVLSTSTRSKSANCLLYDPETKWTIELPLEDRIPRFFWYSESLASLN